MIKRIIVILVFFISSGVYADQVSEQPAQLPEFFEKINEPISLSSASVFYNQDYEKRTLDAFENRFIIVHFWASWCMECKEELVLLDKLQKFFRKKSLLVITISEDFKGAKAVDEYFTKNKIEYLDIYLDKGSKLYQSLGVNFLPISYLIDFDGRVVASSKPGVTVNWDDATLVKYLDEKVRSYQLLPPEFKRMRDKYEEPKEDKEKKSKKETKQVTKKPSIFIN